MLQLKYTMLADSHQHVIVIGDPDGIRDLYWQLTKNYYANDGTAIGSVRVLNLSGDDITSSVMSNPWQHSTRLSHLI